jgi:hypothetical protein
METVDGIRSQSSRGGKVSFDEQPDGDPHGQCAAEIHRLEELVRGWTAMAAVCVLYKHPCQPWRLAMSAETRIEHIRKVMADWHPVKSENNEAFHCKADIEYLLAKVDDLQRLNLRAAKVIRNRMCPTCEGAGEIVHGTSPEDEWSEKCSNCADDEELLRQLDPPLPPPEVVVEDDIIF